MSEQSVREKNKYEIWNKNLKNNSHRTMYKYGTDKKLITVTQIKLEIVSNRLARFCCSCPDF